MAKPAVFIRFFQIARGVFPLDIVGNSGRFHKTILYRYRG